MIGWICVVVVTASVIACIAMAMMRSTGLTTVTVTALNESSEPRDHRIPLIKRHEALPDYELIVQLTNGQKLRLGAQPDTSAVGGLTWRLSEPVSISEVATVRLQDQDKVFADALAEVQVAGASATANGYRFDFGMERSMSVGIVSFFKTPIGMAIAAAFFIGVLVIIAGALA